MLGAAGGIGQPLSLLLKLNPKVTELSCFDLAPVTPGKRPTASRLLVHRSEAYYDIWRQIETFCLNVCVLVFRLPE